MAAYLPHLQCTHCTALIFPRAPPSPRTTMYALRASRAVALARASARPSPQTRVFAPSRYGPPGGGAFSLFARCLSADVKPVQKMRNVSCHLILLRLPLSCLFTQVLDVCSQVAIIAHVDHGKTTLVDGKWASVEREWRECQGVPVTTTLKHRSYERSENSCEEDQFGSQLRQHTKTTHTRPHAQAKQKHTLLLVPPLPAPSLSAQAFFASLGNRATAALRLRTVRWTPTCSRWSEASPS